MRTTDITTTQQVTITYELATLQERIVAFLLDLLILGFSLIALMFLWLGVFGVDSFESFWLFLGLPAFFFYTLVSEILMDGQTLGKKITNIKIVKLTGKEPTNMDYAIRWAFRFIDIWLSGGSIAAIFISSSPKAQRLGGITSNTTLIKVKFAPRFQLEDIERIASLDSYTPIYPQVSRLSEADMLFIKSAVGRFRDYPNKAHHSIIEELSQRLALILEITQLPDDRIEFLKTLLRDYIVLTR